MPSDLIFEWDSRQLDVFRSGKVERALARAMRNAGNGALRSLQKDTVGKVRQRKALSEKRVGDGLRLIFPRGREDIRSLQWAEVVSSKAIPLVDYGHTFGRAGVTVRVNTSGGSKLIRSAFVARMRSGHEGIFARRGKKRLPVDELYSSRLTNVIQNPGLVPALFDAAQTKLATAFPKALERQFKRLRSRGDLAP